ncbi:tetratricopeptide repeat protein [uncultured Phenylobacterium sp.]|uniref:O-linked N-acetylglucosamine transferase, SPINDLY family protein n=1 Tax=uncultured Phenylobacterium sp. TaxID=349273 RepID=UPI0025EBDC09|nr:tetratricopeptide repeat protein [uncultured Phenylobacterium sp.]
MTDRLAAAQAALNAGRRDEAIDHLGAAVDEDPARNVQVYRTLALQLYTAGRFAEGEAAAARGLARHPRDYDLMNMRGVLLRKLRRQPEAVKVLEAAIKVNAKSAAAQHNLANVLLDLKEPVRAEALLTKLVRLEPRNADYLRQLGRALGQQGKIEPALGRLRQSVAMKRDNIDAWLDMTGLLNEEQRGPEAEALLDKAIAANPGNARLLEGKVLVMRRSGQARRAETFMEELLPASPDAGWLHYQLGSLLADRDRVRANTLLRRAVELEPNRLGYAGAMIENLERTRVGDEGGHIEEAYHLAKGLLPRRAEFDEGLTKIMAEVFGRVCDFEALEQIGDFRTLGRSWASSGRHTALMKQMAHVRTDADRAEVMEQHRIWGRMTEAAVARRPIKRPPPRPPGGKIRLGFMSSDLRQHPVGYFALPLFDHLDGQRFEVFVYSFYQGREDDAQRHIARRVTAYRWWPDISAAGAAEKIAEDQLDMLIELGGSTHMNKLEVMAYRPAPVQASWLGYPHSAGLEAIDYFVCDPYVAPAEPTFLLEKPLMLRHAWYPLSPVIFKDQPPLETIPPIARNGYVTFGTANQPHKYSRDVLRTWARIMAQCPQSRFLFIRPESSGASFQANLRSAFAAEGIEGERIQFEAVRGAHLPHYGRIDMSLDTFPQTGGTTTCESLWMGAPCVSLVGPAPYERLSYSVLTNVGLGDLCATTLDGYIKAAVGLAKDPARIADLRANMRTRLKDSPLGRTETWAADFYDVMEQAVRSSSPRLAQPA